MKKNYQILLCALFCLFLGGGLVANTLTPDKAFSQLENRYLQQVPKLSLSTVADGTFMSGAEDYVNDQFVFRDWWVSVKSWSERLSGKQENNGVYFGKNNSLINRVDTPSQETLDLDISYVDALVSNVNVPVYFGLIPSAASIWADRLPEGAPTADEVSIINQLYFATGANTIDLAGPLAAHSGEDIYYRTDHHWTSLGAYYGANALLQAMGLDALDLNDYEKTTVTEDFQGTIFSSSGVRWVPPDAMDIYVPDDGVTVTSYFDGTPSQGSLYVDSYLDQKDKYSYFLGGNQSLCVIETPLTDAPKVLVVRDSYADSLAPFLTQRFSQLHLFDLRYNLTSIKDYVEEHDIDTVVVLYSFDNFATGSNLFALGR